MSNIVYTTALSKEIISTYNHYQLCIEKYPVGDHKINAAFIAFANACDKENKLVLNVIESLNK